MDPHISPWFWEKNRSQMATAKDEGLHGIEVDLFNEHKLLPCFEKFMDGGWSDIMPKPCTNGMIGPLCD
jgi:hypothetical protein